MFGLAFKACTIGSSLFQSLLFFLLNIILQGNRMPCSSVYHFFLSVPLLVNSAWNAYPSVFPNPTYFLNISINSGHSCARFCSVCFTWINSFDFHRSHLRLMLLLFLMCLWGNWSTEVKSLDRDDAAMKSVIWDMNPSRLVPQSVFLAILLCCISL